MANALEKQYAQAIGTVHANDDQRQEKVQQFRTRQLDILLTTTILERGVTFSNIDVYVLKADDWTFTTASLVQIAGRAGRDANYPNGAVYFFYEHYNCRIRDCQRQIKYMNAKEVIK